MDCKRFLSVPQFGTGLVGGQYIQTIKFFGGFQSFAGLLQIVMSK